MWDFLNKLSIVITLISFILGFISGATSHYIYNKKYKKNVINNSKMDINMGKNSDIGIISNEENHGIQIGINKGEINGK